MDTNDGQEPKLVPRFRKRVFVLAGAIAAIIESAVRVSGHASFTHNVANEDGGKQSI